MTRSQEAINAEEFLIAALRQTHFKEIIRGDIRVKFTFTFANYFTKKMERAKTILDLDNCIALPMDALTKSGIIDDDQQVCSFDGSRRKPGLENILEIEIFRFSDGDQDAQL